MRSGSLRGVVLIAALCTGYAAPACGRGKQQATAPTVPDASALNTDAGAVSATQFTIRTRKANAPVSVTLLRATRNVASDYGGATGRAFIAVWFRLETQGAQLDLADVDDSVVRLVDAQGARYTERKDVPAAFEAVLRSQSVMTASRFEGAFVFDVPAERTRDGWTLEWGSIAKSRLAITEVIPAERQEAERDDVSPTEPGANLDAGAIPPSLDAGATRVATPPGKTDNDKVDEIN